MIMRCRTYIIMCYILWLTHIARYVYLLLYHTYNQVVQTMWNNLWNLYTTYHINVLWCICKHLDEVMTMTIHWCSLKCVWGIHHLKSAKFEILWYHCTYYHLVTSLLTLQLMDSVHVRASTKRYTKSDWGLFMQFSCWKPSLIWHTGCKHWSIRDTHSILPTVHTSCIL